MGRLIPNLVAGAIMGLLTVTSAISYSTVIFVGDLRSVLPFGIGLLMLSSTIISVVVTSLSSYPPIIATIAESTVPILALASRQVIQALPNASVEEKLFTVTAMLVMNSLITGTIFVGLGSFKLGSFVRYIPYPVVGGFLAGTGALLLTGSVQSINGLSLQPFAIAAFFQPNIVLQWFPALIFAGVMFAVPQRITHVLIYPGIILGAIALFYLGLGVTGTSIAEAQSQGLLLSNIPSGPLYHFGTFEAFNQANWAVVLQQIPTLAALWLVASIALLLHGNGVELVASRDLDFNRELKVSGLAWLLSGIGGGVGGFASAGENALAKQLGASNRIPGWVVGAMCLAMMVGGAPLLVLFPTFILIGMPLLITLEFFNEWLYEAWFKFSRSDYVIIVLILFVTITVGFLQAIIFGLLAAVVLFAVNYSRLTIIRRIGSGAQYHSNVLRTSDELEILESQGEQAYVVELQGLIFFGTANKLLNQIRDRIDNPELSPVRFVILDFRLVRGLDASAILSFAKLKQISTQKQIHLLYTNLSTEAFQRLKQGDCLEEEDLLSHLFPDLDRGLEWYEQHVLQNQPAVPPFVASSAEAALSEHLKADFSDPKQADRLMSLLEVRQLAEGEYLFHQGDPFDGLYFVASGQVSVVIELGDQQTKRIRTYTVGNTIGEMGLYRRTVRIASVVADKPSTLYFLSSEMFEHIETSDPLLASNIHRFIVNLLAERLNHREQELKNLLESG
jgi:sulfate permease, SulP family